MSTIVSTPDAIEVHDDIPAIDQVGRLKVELDRAMTSAENFELSTCVELFDDMLVAKLGRVSMGSRLKGSI